MANAPTDGPEVVRAPEEPAVIDPQATVDPAADLEADETRPTHDPDYRELPTRKQFGRYELVMEMGHGGMASLFLARIRGPEQFEKLVAVKRIHEHLARETEFTAMFLEEARIAARIHHPNVAAINDLGVIDDMYYISMEYVHGQNLTDLLRAAARQHTSMEWSVVARIGADVAAGLHAAHELNGSDGKNLGVVHRDVSPQNILVSYDGHVKVVDFGIAFAAERVIQTSTGTLKGKVPYMSPEQATGKPVDRRSDIFSLGIVLFEAVCLKRLFKEPTETASLLRVREASVPSPRSIRPELPVSLERIILKALAKDPADRFATADELAEQLNACLVTEGKATTATTLSKTMSRFFHDKKKIKDRQIQQALEEQLDEPIVSAAMESTTQTSLELSNAGTVGAAARTLWSHPGVKIGVAMLILGIVGLVGYLVTREPPSSRAPAGAVNTSGPRPVQRPAGDARARARPTPRNVTLKFLVQPTAAEVVFRGKAYPGASFKAVIPASSTMENVVVRALGYVSQTLAVTPNENNTFTVSLQSVAKPGMRRVVRRPRVPPRRTAAGLLKTKLE